MPRQSSCIGGGHSRWQAPPRVLYSSTCVGDAVCPATSRIAQCPRTLRAGDARLEPCVHHGIRACSGHNDLNSPRPERSDGRHGRITETPRSGVASGEQGDRDAGRRLLRWCDRGNVPARGRGPRKRRETWNATHNARSLCGPGGSPCGARCRQHAPHAAAAPRRCSPWRIIGDDPYRPCRSSPACAFPGDPGAHWCDETAPVHEPGPRPPCHVSSTDWPCSSSAARRAVRHHSQARHDRRYRSGRVALSSPCAARTAQPAFSRATARPTSTACSPSAATTSCTTGAEPAARATYRTHSTSSRVAARPAYSSTVGADFSAGEFPRRRTIGWPADAGTGGAAPSSGNHGGELRARLPPPNRPCARQRGLRDPRRVRHHPLHGRLSGAGCPRGRPRAQRTHLLRSLGGVVTRHLHPCGRQ